MRIIANRSFVFRDYNAPGLSVIRAGASNSPQDVPEWVADTATYRNAVKDGGIIALAVPAPPVQATPAPVVPAQEEPATRKRSAASAAKLGLEA